jgi:hypothetical protein
MSETRVPPALFAAVKSDLQPVRPLATPTRRALALLPIAVILLVGMPIFWGWKTHLAALAPGPSWLLSTLESALSLMILAAAFREAVPGRELSTGTLLMLVAAACGCFFAINPVTHGATVVPASTALRWVWDCISMTVMFSIPALAVPAWLVSRALPNRPALTGALCGLGVGLMADAGLRLFCWYSEYSHVLLAHGGAIAILIGLGALSATAVERLKVR